MTNAHYSLKESEKQHRQIAFCIEINSKPTLILLIILFGLAQKRLLITSNSLIFFSVKPKENRSNLQHLVRHIVDVVVILRKCLMFLCCFFLCAS